VATVPEIISSQQSYVTSWKAQADGFINKLAELANTQFDSTIATLPQGEYVQTGFAAGAVDVILPLRPIREAIADIVGTAPLAPDFAFTPLDPITVADFTRTAPTLNIPLPPSAVLPSAPIAPTLAEPDIPSAPVVSMPVAPVFTSITLPSPPSIEIPSFSSTLPIDDLVTPSNVFSFYEVAYQSDLLDGLKSKVYLDLMNGGYGIESADESAMLDRARAREIEIGNTNVDETLRTFAARGWPVPPGEMAVAVQVAIQDVSDKVSTLSRDIYIKRADQFVENRKFIFTMAKDVENILIGYHNSLMERTLNASKATLEAAISIFEVQVKRYNARLDAYKTEAAVFESRVRAALAQVEIYRTQMEGSKLELEAQRAAVEVYRAQLSGIESIIQIYRTQMDAANIRAGIERTRMDAFRALIDAYQAQVQSKVAEFNMFESQIKGEIAKSQAYEAEVRGYVATVEGSKVKADIALGNLKAEVEQANAKVNLYQAQVDGFKANIMAQSETMKGRVEVFKADVSGYSAAVNALAEAYRIEQLGLTTEAEINIKAADIDIRAAMARLEALKKAAEINLSSSAIGGKFYETVVASTLNSIGTLAAQTSTA